MANLPSIIVGSDGYWYGQDAATGQWYRIDPATGTETPISDAQVPADVQAKAGGTQPIQGPSAPLPAAPSVPPPAPVAPEALPAAPPAAPVTEPAAPYFTSPGPVDVQPGLTAEQWAAYYNETVAARLASNEIDRQINENQRYIAELNDKLQRDLANINNASDERIAQMNADLQQELQAGRISSEEFMQARDLAMRASEFARDLALRTVVADRQYEIDRMMAETDRLAELRQERLLQAQLAANPSDVVAYEMYKRQLTPETYTLAQEFQGAAPEGLAVAGENVPENLLGQPYYPAPPAYSDETMQQLAAATFRPGPQPLYNPNLGGTGVFGADVASPNELSRSEYAGLDPTELGILESYLKAGIEIAPGQRVAINPADWTQQLKKSFIPTVRTTRSTYG